VQEATLTIAEAIAAVPESKPRVILATGSYALVSATQAQFPDRRQAGSYRRSSIHFSPAIPARNNRSFDWFVIGEKENRERGPENPPHPLNGAIN